VQFLSAKVHSILSHLLMVTTETVRQAWVAPSTQSIGGAMAIPRTSMVEVEERAL